LILLTMNTQRTCRKRKEKIFNFNNRQFMSPKWPKNEWFYFEWGPFLKPKNVILASCKGAPAELQQCQVGGRWGRSATSCGLCSFRGYLFGSNSAILIFCEQVMIDLQNSAQTSVTKAVWPVCGGWVPPGNLYFAQVFLSKSALVPDATTEAG
jgi:hypothetical protein